MADQRTTPIQPTAAAQPCVGVIGAGLAGSECAWILAEQYGIQVVLYEMKPVAMTPAQCMPHVFAELVCSNSLKSTSELNPAGILKSELENLGSLILRAAWGAKVPAGEALAVDREIFSGTITKEIRNHPRIRVVAGIVHSLDEIKSTDKLDHIIIATGPLTEGGLVNDLKSLAGSASQDSFYFYDAIAPIIVGSSVDLEIAFFASRENRLERQQSAKRLRDQETLNNLEIQELGATPSETGSGDYLNLPFNRTEYMTFVEQLKAGAKVPHHSFEEPRYFNGCQPIENLAESGPLTLAHGPMKGRGLTDPRTGRWPFAAVQLRKEKLGDDSYNMVGFQTRLTWTAQREIFRTIPGLAQAEFHRMGSLHRNTYLCAPELLGENFAFKNSPHISLCGQIMGVEGYLESAAMGCLLGHLLGHSLRGKRLALPPATTALGCLARHVQDGDPKNYSPMNIHWGLFDPLMPVNVLPNVTEEQNKGRSQNSKMDKATRRSLMSQRAQSDFGGWMSSNGITPTPRPRNAQSDITNVTKKATDGVPPVARVQECSHGSIGEL
jgi:methylenetetrahydrofolate--tRNA-(uracil-5-)-methyltransferase